MNNVLHIYEIFADVNYNIHNMIDVTTVHLEISFFILKCL